MADTLHSQTAIPIPAVESRAGLRWRIALLAASAIVLSYLDRQNLPWTLSQIHEDYPFSDQVKALFDSAFLISYGLMYLGGGWLLDRLGTRRGFLLVMIFWSLASASQGVAANYGFRPIFGMAFALVMLVTSRFLLGMGEGGGFPAATRVVAEWFPVHERSTAMGIINAGTAVGAVIAPWLILLVLNYAGWFGLAAWRWVFFLSGALGLLWTFWWVCEYHPPEEHPRLSGDEQSKIVSGRLTQPKQVAKINVPPLMESRRKLDVCDFQAGMNQAGPDCLPLLGERAGVRAGLPQEKCGITCGELPGDPEKAIPLATLLSHGEVWAIVGAKFLTDAAWYFYMFWLPKFLMETFAIKFNAASTIGWIPYAAAGVGCLAGGGLSSWLLQNGASVNRARKTALGLSAAFMPWVMLVPRLHSVGWVIFIFSLAFLGQQSWSTLVMTLPADMIPRRAVGTLAGLVGFGGAMGGVLLGQAVGWVRAHGYSYTPALLTAGSLHVAAFILICLAIPKIQPLELCSTNN